MALIQKTAHLLPIKRPVRFAQLKLVRKESHSHSPPAVHHHIHRHIYGDTYVGTSKAALKAAGLTAKKNRKKLKNFDEKNQAGAPDLDPKTHYGRFKRMMHRVIDFLRPICNVLLTAVGFLLSRVNFGFQFRVPGLPFG